MAMNNNLNLDTIAGYKEEKEELKKIINLIKNYDKYKEMGIQVPRGIILQGPPGCGKTLIASVIASECKVPFFSFKAGADGNKVLTELKRVYRNAEKETPSIVYLDELVELVTNKRFASDTSRACLQFLLTKLDGVQKGMGVLTIASTNAYDDLPNALLRSGRMDKKLKIELPDVESREEILKFYTKKFPIFSKLNLKILAIKLNGMSGADIKTLINNALIEYIDQKEFVEVDDFTKLVNEMNFETIGKKWKSAKNIKKILAHEVGHSLVGWVLEGNHGSISALKYGDTAGFTSFTSNMEEIKDEYDEDELQFILNKHSAFNQFCIGLGGMAGELVYYGIYDNGVGGDTNQLRELHKTLCEVGVYGIDYMTYRWSSDSEKLKCILEKHFIKKLKKALKTSIKIIKKYKYLGRYIIDLAIEHDDALTETQIEEAINYYKAHKFEIISKYKNKPLVEGD